MILTKMASSFFVEYKAISKMFAAINHQINVYIFNTRRNRLKTSLAHLVFRFRYLDDFLNIDNPNFDQMVGQIYPTELQLNKANSSDTEALFLNLNLSITNGIVSSKNL